MCTTDVFLHILNAALTLQGARQKWHLLVQMLYHLYPQRSARTSSETS